MHKFIKKIVVSITFGKNLQEVLYFTYINF